MDDIKRKIAYFSMEIGIDSDVPTYSGGLGVLAGDTLRSAADLEIPMIAVTLCYSAGYFYQMIDPSGNQVERDFRWEFSEDFEKVPQTITVEIQGKMVKIEAWKYEVVGHTNYTIPVYLLDSDVEGNEDWQKRFTHVLYDATPFQRVAQEMILGIGGVKMLRALGYDELCTFHMNEGHASFLTLELLREFNGNQEAVKDLCAFTTHTPVWAGHDVFSYDLIYDIFREQLPQNIRELGGHDKLNMTLLGLNMSRYINAVSQKHKEVSSQMFPHHTIDGITNGVHISYWVCPCMKELFDRTFPHWRYDPSQLENALELSSMDLWKAHEKAKSIFLDYEKSHSWLLLSEKRLTIGFARRLTGYKRPTLLFTDVDRLGRICRDKVQFIFAGKTHPRDIEGKHFIKRIHEKAYYLWDNYRTYVVFLENYDMDLAHLMTSGVDIWLNNPRRFQEASGTSGMKAALNGVLNFSVLDGWWIEGYAMDPMAGWAIGPDPADPNAIYNDDHADSNDIYTILENEIIPLFSNDKKDWIERMKHTIKLAAFFNTHRMVNEYSKKAWHLEPQPRWKHISEP